MGNTYRRGTEVLARVVSLWIAASFLLATDGAQLTPTASTCSSDLDCSLNGICIPDQKSVKTNENHFESPTDDDPQDDIRTCLCDKPWFGTHCEKLKFLPLKGRPNTSNGAAIAIDDQGYGMVPNVTTWGGGILQERTGDKPLYHLYVSRMTNDCPLMDWTTNSRIDHAIAPDVRGPYRFVDVAIPTFSHNPAPVELSSRETKWKYAMFHLGTGTDGENGGKDCRTKPKNNILYKGVPSKPQTAQSRTRNMLQQRQQPSSTIHVSESLYGPWIPLEDHDLGHCNNPAPWVHPSNGTLYVACGDGKIRRSDRIRGPYEVIAEFPDNHGPNATKAYEDPCLFTDSRGQFHCIYHAYQRDGGSDDCTDTLISAHAYSKDGLEWRLSPTPPYGSQVDISISHNASRVTLASRERPKLYFDEFGAMTHMVEGVCGSPRCDASPYKPWCVHCKYQEWDFTLVSALDAS